jgi:hypothetical protein
MFKGIHVSTSELRVGNRYVFHKRAHCPLILQLPPFIATVCNTYTRGSELDIQLSSRTLLNGQPEPGIMTIPAKWLVASALDIPYLPEELCRLIGQYL